MLETKKLIITWKIQLLEQEDLSHFSKMSF